MHFYTYINIDLELGLSMDTVYSKYLTRSEKCGKIS